MAIHAAHSASTQPFPFLPRLVASSPLLLPKDSSSRILTLLRFFQDTKLHSTFVALPGPLPLVSYFFYSSFPPPFLVLIRPSASPLPAPSINEYKRSRVESSCHIGIFVTITEFTVTLPPLLPPFPTPQIPASVSRMSGRRSVCAVP